MSELKACPFCGVVLSVSATGVNGHPANGCIVGKIGLSHEDVSKWNIRPIEDGLRADLARLTAELEREKDNCGKFYLALEKIYDALGMDDHTGSCIPEIDRLTEQVARLKEDAIRLASTYVIEVFPHEWVCRGGCHHWARFGEQIEHSPDCPITLHRALMKELE